MFKPEILGTVADWVGGIGTIVALIYATKQIKIKMILILCMEK